LASTRWQAAKSLRNATHFQTRPASTACFATFNLTVLFLPANVTFPHLHGSDPESAELTTLPFLNLFNSEIAKKQNSCDEEI